MQRRIESLTQFALARSSGNSLSGTVAILSTTDEFPAFDIIALVVIGSRR
jgi:hypothetical protein